PGQPARLQPRLSRSLLRLTARVRSCYLPIPTGLCPPSWMRSPPGRDGGGLVRMNRFLHGVTRAVAETFALPGPILEVGSFQVAGQEDIANLRSLFPAQEYLGIDVRPGPGVDLVADVEALPQADASVGTVIAMNTFEHVT